MTRQQSAESQQIPSLDKQNLQTLVETVPALVWRARPDGHIDYVNKRLLDYLGSPVEEIVGWGIVDRIRDHMKNAPPRKSDFDLNEAINEVIVLGRSAIIKNGVSVQTRLFDGLLRVHGDRVQLQPVILNLILNAVEAMGSIEHEVQELSITTKQDEAKGVVVTVRDSGPGIDPKHLDHVFDAFYTTKSRGVAMGLSICRSIIPRPAVGGRKYIPRGSVSVTLPNGPSA
jgi:signal transduction histidine kinase